MILTKSQLRRIIKEQLSDEELEKIKPRFATGAGDEDDSTMLGKRKHRPQRPEKAAAETLRAKWQIATTDILNAGTGIAAAFNSTKHPKTGRIVIDPTGLWNKNDKIVEKNVARVLKNAGFNAYHEKKIPPKGSQGWNQKMQDQVDALTKAPDVIYFDDDYEMYVVEVKKTDNKDFSSVPIASNPVYNWFVFVAATAGYILKGKMDAMIAGSREKVKKLPDASKISYDDALALKKLSGPELDKRLDTMANSVVTSSSRNLQDFIKSILKNRILGDKSAKLDLPFSVAGKLIRADIKFEGKEVKTKRNYLRSIIEEQYTLAVIHKFVRESFELIPEQIQPGVIQVTLRRTAPTVSDPQQQKQLAQLIAKILDKEGSGESTQAEYAQAESAGVTFEQLKDLVGQYGKSSYVSKAQAYSPETYKKASLKKSFQKTWRGV